MRRMSNMGRLDITYILNGVKIGLHFLFMTSNSHKIATYLKLFIEMNISRTTQKKSAEYDKRRIIFYVIFKKKYDSVAPLGSCTQMQYNITASW